MNSPTACIKCGGELSLGQSYCQRCGTPQNDPSANIGRVAQPTTQGGGFRKFLKWGGIGCGGFVALFVMLGIFGAIVGTEGDNDNSAVKIVPDATSTLDAAADSPGRISTATPEPTLISTTTPVPTATPTPMPTATATPVPIQMGLEAFLDQYDQNKVRANARLRYKENGRIPVTTSGIVDEVEELYVILTPSLQQYWSQSLYCYYADTEAALQLTKGQRVSLTGRVSGTDGYSSRVYMFGCKFEGMQLETNPTVSIQELRKNVVQVFCTRGSIFSSELMGTGIIVDAKGGIVLTVHHVVADENECSSIEVQLQGSEDRIPATPVKHCASIDRARLSISAMALSDLSLQQIYRAAAPAQTDQEIHFWGYGSGELRMETGIVQDVLGKDIVADAYAVPGDSGSPVFDENGHLLGTMSRSNRSDRAVFTGDEC